MELSAKVGEAVRFDAAVIDLLDGRLRIDGDDADAVQDVGHQGQAFFRKFALVLFAVEGHEQVVQQLGNVLGLRLEPVGLGTKAVQGFFPFVIEKVALFQYGQFISVFGALQLPDLVELVTLPLGEGAPLHDPPADLGEVDMEGHDDEAGFQIVHGRFGRAVGVLPGCLGDIVQQGQGVHDALDAAGDAARGQRGILGEAFQQVAVFPGRQPQLFQGRLQHVGDVCGIGPDGHGEGDLDDLVEILAELAFVFP